MLTSEADGLEMKDLSTGNLEQVRAAIEASGDVVYFWELDGDKITWSGDLGTLLPVFQGQEATTGREYLRNIIPEDLIARRRALNAHRLTGEPFDCEYRIADPGGPTTWINERGSAEIGEDGRPVRLVGTLRAVTTRKQNEARLKYEIRHDKLTGLYNRLRLGEALEDIMAFNQRYDRQGAYIVVGVDHLSLINNAFGHEAGDAVIVELSHRFDARPPIGDAVGRVGGDCFGIVVADISAEETVQLADRVLEEMRSTPVDTPSGPVFVTVSIGYNTFSSDQDSAHDVMAKADVALREAKLMGRNTALAYRATNTSREGQKENIAMAERVLSALKNDKLALAYQPIVSSSEDHHVEHYECLLRMIADDGSLIGAGHFIPVIEEMGLIRQVDLRVLELAVQTLMEHDDISLAVNLSAVTVGDLTWQKRLIDLVRQREGIADRLMIELTETMALRDLEETITFVNAVRDLGCEVALDDFGAGNTSFRNLRALPVDIVKIDGIFVRDIAKSSDNQLFLRSIVDLTRGFGLKTIAECVETAEDARILEEAGVDFMQGWHFGKPETGTPWTS